MAYYVESPPLLTHDLSNFFFIMLVSDLSVN